MAEQAEDQVNKAVNTVVENYSKLPASNTSNAPAPGKAPRLFNRSQSVHSILGGGKAADVLLWRNVPLSGGVLAAFTIAWILFEWTDYTLLSLVSNVLLFSVVILFVWSNAAALLNRSPPPLPELSLSEDVVLSIASSLRIELNKILKICHDVALGKDFVLFLKVCLGLWIVSVVGSWVNFLTLVYIVVVVSHTFPVLYEKYEDEIDKYAKIAGDHANTQYKKLDANVLSKIPRAQAKDKKSQ